MGAGRRNKARYGRRQGISILLPAGDRPAGGISRFSQGQAQSDAARRAASYPSDRTIGALLSYRSRRASAYALSEKARTTMTPLCTRSLFITTLVLLSSSGMAGPASARPRPCAVGAQECPISLKLPSKRPSITITGYLSRRKPSTTYQFSNKDKSVLSWTYQGPAARLVLADSSGTTFGPGLPDKIELLPGRIYRLSVSSNMMAENIYGKFKIKINIIPDKSR